MSIADVADHAGLGKASVFHHFPTKAHLYCAVMARVLDDLEAELTRALARGGSPTVRLDRWIDTVIDVLGAHPTYPRLLLRVLVEDEELPARLPDGIAANRAMRRIGVSALRLLREGMDTGDFRRLDPAHTLQTLIGATVHPLSTGRFGDELVGASQLAPAQLRRRKDSVKWLVHAGIVVPPGSEERNPR